MGILARRHYLSALGQEWLRVAKLLELTITSSGVSFQLANARRWYGGKLG